MMGYNQHHLIYSITMYGLFLIAVKSTTFYTFLYFSISDVQLQHDKMLSRMPGLVAVWLIDCHSWDDVCLSDEISCYKATPKEECGALKAPGYCRECKDNTDNTFVDDRDLHCLGETRCNRATRINTKFKHPYCVMNDGTDVGNYVHFPMEFHLSEKHVNEKLIWSHQALTYNQATYNEDDLYHTMTKKRVIQLYSSVQTGYYHVHSCLTYWQSKNRGKDGKRETVTETKVKRFNHVEYHRPWSGCHGETPAGYETDAIVLIAQHVSYKCGFCSVDQLCRRLRSCGGLVSRREAFHKHELGKSVKSNANTCNIIRRTYVCFSYCTKKCNRSERHGCHHKSCVRTEVQIGKVKWMYVNMICVYIILLSILLEMLSMLKRFSLTRCYDGLYTICCNHCSHYDKEFKKKILSKWNRENIFKQRELFNWFQTIPGQANSCEPGILSGISNYLYHMESQIKKTKDSIVSGLWELQADYISVPQVTAYPLLSTLNHYLTRVQNEGNLPQDEEMCYEIRRYQSYNSVEVRSSPMRLAQSGFYATGNGNETRCYSCKKTYTDWRLMDQPDRIHRSLSPDCPHLNRGDQRNVPILSSSDDNTSVYGVLGEYPTNSGSDETSTSQSTATTATPAASELAAVTSASSGISLPDLPGLDISRAVYPQYRDLSTRLDSYQGWGWSHVQDPQVLARAGFYYAGYRDCVRCFYCGVGLRTWESEDDPWVEHVRWRSSCDYVRLMRGEQFAIQALASGPSVSSSYPPPRNNQAQKILVADTGHGTDTAVKAEEMGFQRSLIERAMVELTTSHNVSRGTIPLETLLEKLLVLNDETHTTPAPPPRHRADTTPTTSIPSWQQTESPSATDKQPTNVNISGTVASSVGSAANEGIYSSVTSQKAMRTVQGDQRVNEDETEVLSASQERQLEEENQSLRDESTCKICMDNPSCIVFLPCGHLVTCAECAPALRKCPICRALIRGTVRAHTVSSEVVKM